MDENMSEGDSGNNKDDCDNIQINENKNNKRMKILSEEGTSNDNEIGKNIINSDSASTSNSNNSNAKKSGSFRNRNYRKNSHKEDSSANESDHDEELPNESLTSCLSNHNSASSADDDNNDEISDAEQHDSETDIISESDIISNTDPETDSGNEKSNILDKTKPKHSWYVVPEVIKRQYGYSSKLNSAELFRNQCYGSLHSVQRLELMYKLEEHCGCVNSLNFYPDGSLLASGSDDLHVVVWDWKVGKCLFRYATKHRSNVFQSKFLHLTGDLHIATCSRDGQVRLARLSNDGSVRENRKLGSHKAACHKLALLPDQPHIILSAGEDSYVMSHDVRKQGSESILKVKADVRSIPLYSIHGHPLRTHEFCLGGQDDTVRVYDQRKTSAVLSTYSPFKEIKTNHFRGGRHVTSAVYNYNGQEILASFNDADIYLFDTVDSVPGEFVHRYAGHRNGATIKGVSFFGPKSEFIVSGSDCGNIFFWEKNTEAIVQCMPGDDSGVVNCLEPHPKLPFICTSGLDWDVKVWVPSCEVEPNLEKLPKIIKKNKQARNSLGLATDAPVLWMLWQHLRGRRSRRLSEVEMNLGFLDSEPSSGSDDDMNETNENDEDIELEDEEEDEDDSTMDLSPECATS